jgi:signal transduction histidine kinase
LRAANLAFTQTLDLDAVLDALLDYLHQFIPYDHASVVLLEEDAGPTVRATRSYPFPGPCGGPPEAAGEPEEPSLIRRVLESQESLLLSDLNGCKADIHGQPSAPSRADPKGRRANKECGPSWLGVPLVASGQVIGVCSMHQAQAGFFTQEHRQLAESLALQAAIAIQHARLFEQVRVGRERLQNLSRRLVEVQETERRHIARELHDQAGQALTSLMVGLRLLEEGSRDAQAVGAHVAELKSTTNGVLESLHRLASDLRPASLDHLGLGAALRQYTDAFSRQHNLVVQFEMVGLPFPGPPETAGQAAGAGEPSGFHPIEPSGFHETKRLSPAMETALYRIVQEGLTNVARHAQATHVSVLLARHGDRVITIVEDNGLGFDPMAATHSGRLGLLGMRERAEMLGGSLVVESSPGIGTTLCVEVPYDHPFEPSGYYSNSNCG